MSMFSSPYGSQGSSFHSSNAPCCEVICILSIYFRSSGWSGVLQPEKMVDLLQAWWPVVPGYIQRVVDDELIMPRIIEHIKQWTPQTPTGPLHHWILPWLSILHAECQSELMALVINRFHVFLSAWHPSDMSYFDWILPWKHVFDTSMIGTLCSRSILPALEEMLKNDFKIDARSQETECLEQALLWANFIPLSQFSALLERSMFPQWWSVLYLWLTSSAPDYREIAEWYQAWRSMFPPELMDQPTMQLAFRKALDIINGLLDDPSLSLAAFVKK